MGITFELDADVILGHRGNVTLEDVVMVAVKLVVDFGVGELELRDRDHHRVVLHDQIVGDADRIRLGSAGGRNGTSIGELDLLDHQTRDITSADRLELRASSGSLGPWPVLWSSCP